MKFIPPADLLNKAEGVEQGLRQYQRLGRYGWLIPALLLAWQYGSSIADEELFKKLKAIRWEVWPPWGKAVRNR